MDRSEAGRRGNQAAREKNPDHQRDAGRKGIRGLADRYFQGSIGDAMSWLRSRRNEYQLEALVAEKQAAMLANGRDIVVEELPILCDAECDPSYWREMVRDQGRGRRHVG